MPRESRTSEAPSIETKAVSLIPAGKYKLMAFYLVYGRYILYEVTNPKNVVAVAPSDVEFTVGEQELSADVLNKDTSSVVFVPDSVANTLDAVRTLVLP